MLHPNVRLFDKGVIEGKGLVAIAPIKAGEVVSRLEPGQPMTSVAEVLTWSPEEQDELLHYGYQCSEDWVVSEQGEEKYMNHSCDPNTWWGDDDTMVARRDIAANEELTYDYATTETAIPFEMTCRCGAANCRIIVRNMDYLDPAWQARFGQYLPSHTRAAIAAHQSE